MFEQRVKQKFLEKLLAANDLVAVMVNTQVEGVALPEHLLKEPTVTLEISRLFRGALEIGKEDISQDLLFSGVYFNCRLPYNAIWSAAAGKDQRVWPECAPQAVISALTSSLAQQNIEKDRKTPPEQTKPQPKLSAAPRSTSPNPAPAKPKAARPALAELVELDPQDTANPETAVPSPALKLTSSADSKARKTPAKKDEKKKASAKPGLTRVK